MSIEGLAYKMRIKRVECICHWEDGEDKPILFQAQKLAHVLRIPFGYLYFSWPPFTDLPIFDFRNLPDSRENIFKLSEGTKDER